MYRLLLAVIFISSLLTAKCQLGRTEVFIVQEKGSYDTVYLDRNRNRHLVYYGEYVSKETNTVFRRATTYIIGHDKLCGSIIITEPKSEYNGWNSQLNESMNRIEDGDEVYWKSKGEKISSLLERDEKNVYVFFFANGFEKWLGN